MDIWDTLECEFGCDPIPPVHINIQCPIHNPIDVIAHDAIQAREEPIRAELRIANTSQAMRKKVTAASNGHSDKELQGYMRPTFPRHFTD